MTGCIFVCGYSQSWVVGGGGEKFCFIQFKRYKSNLIAYRSSKKGGGQKLRKGLSCLNKTEIYFA